MGAMSRVALLLVILNTGSGIMDIYESIKLYPGLPDNIEAPNPSLPYERIQHTASGCACKQQVTDTNDGRYEVTNNCSNPNRDSDGDWCMVADESCEGRTWGHCKASTTHPTCNSSCSLSAILKVHSEGISETAWKMQQGPYSAANEFIKGKAFLDPLHVVAEREEQYGIFCDGGQYPRHIFWKYLSRNSVRNTIHRQILGDTCDTCEVNKSHYGLAPDCTQLMWAPIKDGTGGRPIFVLIILSILFGIFNIIIDWGNYFQCFTGYWSRHCCDGRGWTYFRAALDICGVMVPLYILLGLMTYSLAVSDKDVLFSSICNYTAGGCVASCGKACVQAACAASPKFCEANANFEEKHLSMAFQATCYIARIFLLNPILARMQPPSNKGPFNQDVELLMRM